MKLSNKLRKGFTLVELLVVIAIIVALAALAGPEVMKKIKQADMVTTVNNGRQIYASLFDFEQTYGSFPSRETAEEDSEFDGLDTESSNGLLGQLVVSGANEKIFFAKGGAPRNKKPDEVTTEIENILEEGECGFGYLVIDTDDGEIGMSSSGSTSRPICLAPVAQNSDETDITFNYDAYEGKAVLVLLDGSAESRKIGSRSGKLTGQGLDPFDTNVSEEDSIWRDTRPILKKPL